MYQAYVTAPAAARATSNVASMRLNCFRSERASDMPLPHLPRCKLPGHDLPIMDLFYANVQLIGGTNGTFRVLVALHRALMGLQIAGF